MGRIDRLGLGLTPRQMKDGAGDVILLIEGGHGFEVLEEIEMVEVKQGPYAGERDKERFTGVGSDQVKVRA